MARAALVLTALFLLPLTAKADTRDAALVGAGPAATRAECPAGTVMVGVVAQAGQAVTLVAPECASVANGFAWQETGVFSSGSIGASNPGAEAQNATCAPGSFVVSVGANLLASPAAVGMLWIACQTSPAAGAPRGGPVILSSNPGAAVSGTGISQCNPDEAATGIAGAATDTVGAIGLICSPLASLAPSPDTIAGAPSADAGTAAGDVAGTNGEAIPGEAPGMNAMSGTGDSPGMESAAPDMNAMAGPVDSSGPATAAPGASEAPGMAAETTPADTSGAGAAGPGADADTLAAFGAAVNGAGQSTSVEDPGAAPGGPGSDTAPGGGAASGSDAAPGGGDAAMGPATGAGADAMTEATSPDEPSPAPASGGPGDPNLPSADVATLEPAPVQPGDLAPVASPSDDWKNLPEDKLTQAASLRDAPGMNSKILKAVPGGTVVHYSEHEKSWCHIFYDDGEGWVSTMFIGCGLPKVAKSTKTKTKSTGSTASTTQPSAPPIFGTITLPNGLQIHIGP